MRNKSVTQAFYIGRLGFEDIGAADFREYLILKKDQIEIHFFLLETLALRKITDKPISQQVLLTHYLNTLSIMGLPSVTSQILGTKGVFPIGS